LTGPDVADEPVPGSYFTRARRDTETAVSVPGARRHAPTRTAGGVRARRTGRRGRVVVPALASGVGLALSLPPWGFWILAPLAAALLWWCVGGLRLRSRFFAGWLSGLGLFVPGLWWATSFNTYGGAVLMAVEALAPALACAVAPRRRRGRTVALAGGMVLAEYVRGMWPFGGLPIGSVALGQAAGPLAGVARLGGPLLLVALVWLAGGAIGVATTTVVDRARGATRPQSARRRVGTSALCLALVAGVGVAGEAAPDGGPAVGVLRVASVQGGGARGLRQSEVEPTVVYGATVAATETIPGRDGGQPPGLVLWPEDVVALDGPLDGTVVERQLASLAVRLHAVLVAGVTETEPQGRFRNEIVAFSASGHLVARFEKVHRVPFGEYVPYRGFFAHFANLQGVPLDAIPGHGDGVLHTPAGALGTLVSYEVFYAGRGRVAARNGARLLVVPTNTSSYRTSQVPTQEIAAARLQAISEGRDLVQAAPTGFSAVVDNRGRVLARSALAVRTVIVRDVALRDGATLYERFGDLPVVVLAALGAAAGLLAGRREDDTAPTPRRAPSRRAVDGT
jgi:apolipoprotein N-acyltransferase